MISRALAAILLAAQASDPRAQPAPEPEPAPATPTPEPEPEPDPTKPIPPEPTPGVTPVPGSPADPSTNEADKRIGLGIDAVFLFPFGELADATGVLVGPLVRFGYRVLPSLETSLRAGYLFAYTKDQPGGVRTKLDLLPVWIEARWFIIEQFTGPYAAIAGGLNMYLPTIEPPIPGPAGDRVTELRVRGGVNVGAGFVLSASLPIDLRAQILLPNLIGRDDALKEMTHFGVSLSVGYTFQF
jgi:hypothetical protein